MRKALRVVSVILCLILVASCFYGCSVNINIDVKHETAAGPAVGVDATVAPTTATPTPATTVVPGTTTSQNETTAAPQSGATEATKAEDPKPANAAPSTKEEIVAEYNKVYDKTKATGTFLGEDKMTCESVVVEGKEQGIIKNAAGTFMATKGKDMQLPPYTDNDKAMKSLITADDIETAEYKDNGDGTATIKIVPKEVKNSRRLADSQGKVFNVMEDVAGALASVPVVSWAQGDANSNVVLTEKEGYAEIIYDKSTGMMTKATYVLVTYAEVNHVNVMFIKDKSGMAKFVYTTTFPQGAQ